MSFLTDLFSGGASKLVDSVGNTLDKVITTKAEKLQLNNEMQKAEMDYQIDLAKLSIEERQIMYQDTASARQREEVLSQSPTASKLGKNISSYLAIAATVLCFALFYILVFTDRLSGNEANRQIVIYIVGVLSALLTQVFGYYFGSSAGSAAKSQTIDQQLKATTPVTPGIIVK